MKRRILSVLLALCMALSLLPTVVFAQETVGQAATAAELTAALADSGNYMVRLTADITITTDVTVSRSVTLDLNDHVLTLTGESLFFTVSGQDTKVTLTDSAETKTARKFSINQDGAWVPDENGDKTVSGGVITGGKTGADIYGTPAVNSGVRIQDHGTLTVTDVTVSAPVRNIMGTIAGSGTFNGTVINENNLTGGIFNGTVANYKGRYKADSKISGGIFYGTVANGYNYYNESREESLDGRNGGEIAGGTFYGKVTNAFNNKISGGSFYGEVDNRERSSSTYNWRGVLAGGTFYAGHPGTVADGCYTVTYDYGDLDGTYAIQIVQKWEAATRPDDPEVQSIHFADWYTGSYATGIYDFSKAVTGNMTLYAGWREAVLGIIITDKDGNEVYVTAANLSDVLGDGTVSYTEGGYDSSKVPDRYWDDSKLYITDEAVRKLLAGEEIPGVELNKLTLNGANLQKIETFCPPGLIYLWYFPIELKGENQITYTGDGAALDWTRGTVLAFTGDGSLTLEAPNASAVAFGDEGQYYQRSGAVSMKAKDYGMAENPGSFTFQDGSLTIQAGDPANASSGVFRSALSLLQKCSITDKATFRMGDSANNPLQFHTPYEWESLFDQYHEAQADGVINHEPNYLSLFTSRTVTFDTNGGSAMDAQTVAYGGTITPAVPTKSGYTFAGWYLGGESFAPDTPVTANLTLTAQWTEKSYTVRFEGADMADKTTGWSGKVLEGVSAPTKTGYDFAGWKCGDVDVSAATTYADLAENDSVGSITLTAQWTVKSYTVHFEGADIASKTTGWSGKVLEGVSAPTKAGYDFAGWKCGDTDVSAATTYADLAENDSVGSITLTAQWTAKSYTVRFEGADMADKTTGWSGKVLEGVSAPTKTGYDFEGWKCGDVVVSEATTYAELAENDSVGSISLTAQWTAKSYTVRFEGADMADKTTGWSGKVLEGVSAPTKTGFDFAGWKCGDVAVSAATTYADLAENDSVDSITLTAQWEDNEPPIGTIQVDTNRWNNFLNKITFNLFFRNTQRVEITASDTSGETVKIEYLLTDTEMTQNALAGEAFTEYTGPFSIDPDREYIIYARLTDGGSNVSYISSDGMVLDATAPGIMGIEDGATYCQAQTVTIDEKYVNLVTVNGQEVKLDGNGQFILAPAEGPQQITVTDQAKNSTSMTVTVHDGHTAAADDGNCATPVYCVYHSDVVVIAAKQHDFSGDWHRDDSHHWHVCQNSGCTVADAPADHSGSDDGDCTTAVVCACGYVLTEAQAGHTWGAWSSDGNGTHTRRCTADGCTQGVETESCSGGTATCHSKAVCDVCGGEYGEIDPDHHDGGTEIRGQTAASCTQAGYSGDTCCRGCGAVLTQGAEIPATGHSGGTATCHSKAICDACGDEYGEIDPDNHEGGTEIRGQAAASCTDAGYSGDICCRGCGAVLTQGAEIPATGHSGGTATCHSKAVCDACGSEYGEIDPDNHDGGTEIRGQAAASCTQAGYSGDTCCRGCGAVLAQGSEIPATGHSGGTATCHSKAVCDACGSEYGEIDPDYHEELRHFPSKAATTDAEGHVEYWYCVDCRRYYTDAEATKEVTGADIVTAKLPGDQPTPPTGDSSSFPLWVAALFISGGLTIGAAVIGRAGIRRSKRNKE